MTNEEVQAKIALNPKHLFYIPVTVAELDTWLNRDTVKVWLGEDGASGSVSLYTSDMIDIKGETNE